jgi:hypothetical protein
MMLCTILLAFVSQAAVGPALPAGCDTRFQDACLRIEQSLESGDFEGAKGQLALLPSANAKISWDDSAVPAEKKALYAKARDKALAAWKKALPELELSLGEPAGIRVSFVPSIESKEGDLLKPGARHTFGGVGEPRVQSLVSLNRGQPAVPAGEKDVQNEVAYAIGAYLGLAPSPLFGHCMGRTDQVAGAVSLITTDERTWAAANLDVARILREASQNKVRLTPGKSQIEVAGPEPKETSVLQGARPGYKFTISNKGNAVLNYRITSTCACLVTDADKQIAPGQSRTIEAKLDTTEFMGELVKNLYIYSNDPVRPIMELPIRSQVTPRYRFLSPGGDKVLMGDGDVEFSVFLAIPEGAPLALLDASIDGLEGQAAIAPWKGTMPDPDLNEGPKARSGYQLSVKLPSQNLFGRRAVNVVVRTPDAVFGRLQYTFWVQKGIVALPFSLYLGSSLSKLPASGDLIVSQPGKPFKIVSISSDLACLSASSQSVRGDCEYKVTVKYDGSAKPGPLKGMLEIRTDDPKQPIVKVMVLGEVK